MFRILAIIASTTVALAFAPCSMRLSTAELKMSYETAIGAQPPLGFWDPLGLLNGTFKLPIYIQKF